MAGGGQVRRAGTKKSRFTNEQIIGFLKQAEGGIPIKRLC